mmetsp:Transcript_25447/g.88791  ORF Transcript_25447/g.88791 Transcript_25447/m.88791 type:complete len:232 (-) Transcript_25447:742-1437(-)
MPSLRRRGGHVPVAVDVAAAAVTATRAHGHAQRGAWAVVVVAQQRSRVFARVDGAVRRAAPARQLHRRTAVAAALGAGATAAARLAGAAAATLHITSLSRTDVATKARRRRRAGAREAQVPHVRRQQHEEVGGERRREGAQLEDDEGADEHHGAQRRVRRRGRRRLQPRVSHGHYGEGAPDRARDAPPHREPRHLGPDVAVRDGAEGEARELAVVVDERGDEHERHKQVDG